ncbi:MAG: AbrB/MazE/SpoVT family DNA-binding domain-containing protein [Candidatus Woesearchaeota archaeon]
MISNIKTVKITEKGQIVIPKELRDKKGFKKGDKVAIMSYEDKIVLRPLMIVSERMQTAYASEESLAKEWDSKEEDEAWKNL